MASAIDSVPTPDGVRLQRFFFDSDHSGDPAIRVVFGVSKKIPLTKRRVTTLTQFRIAVGDALWKLSLGPIPYVTFEDVR